MTGHLRAAVLTVVLAGGTLAAYFTAYALMERPAVATPDREATIAAPAAVASAANPGATDISAREACAGYEQPSVRTRCLQDISGAVRTVRIIGLSQVATTSSAASAPAFVSDSALIQTGRSIAIGGAQADR